VIEIFKYKIQAIKTDDGAIFTNALDLFCRENNIIHYLIDPGKPAQNGKVERSEIIQGLSLDRDWTENMSEM